MVGCWGFPQLKINICQSSTDTAFRPGARAQVPRLRYLRTRMTTNNLEIQGYCYLRAQVGRLRHLRKEQSLNFGIRVPNLGTKAYVLKLATDNLGIQACR